MKKVLFAFSTVFFILIMSYCSQVDQSPIEISKDCATPSTPTLVEIDLGIFASETKVHFSKHVSETSESSYSFSQFDHKKLQQFSDLVASTNQNDIYHTFILAKNVNDEKLANSHILGLGLVYYADGEYISYFYEETDGNLTERSELKFRSSKIRSGIYHLLLKQLTGDKPQVAQGVYHLSSSSVNQITLNGTTEEYYSAKNSVKANAKQALGPEPDYCEPPCNTSGWYDCIVPGDGSYWCENEGPIEPAICPEEENREQLYASSELTASQIDGAYDSDLHHEFRDEFMSEYETGRKYTYWFYRVGFLLDGTEVPLSTLLKSISVLMDINEAIEKLMNPGVNGSEVVIDSDFADDLIDLINDYLDLLDDDEYQDILNSLIDDIESYEGLTVDQILAII